MSGSTIPAAALAALLLAAGAAPAEDGLLAVKAKRILPVSGPPIDDGVVLVRGGKIEAVGNVAIPPLARVIDAGDGWVCPGFVEAHAQTGLDRGNEQVPVVPFVSALDALDPSHPGVEDALRDGVTTLLVIPGNQTQVGGQGILVRPRGRTVEEMLVRRGAALKLSLEPVRGTTRAGQVAALRKAFREAVEWRDQREKRRAEAAAAPGGAAPGDDPRRQGILDLLEKRIPAVIYAPMALDCRNAFSRHHERAARREDGLEIRAEYRMAACWAVEVSVKIAQFAYLAAGSDGLRNHEGANRLQRCFRDIHAGSQHRHTDHHILGDCGTVLLGVAKPNLVL